MIKVRILVALLLLVFALPLLVPSSTAIGNPMIAINIDQSEQYAAITRDTDAVVSFTGTVQCQMPVDNNVQSVVINMVAECGNNWSYNIEPERMEFSRTVSDIAYILTVYVPTTAEYPANEVKVFGNYRVQPGIYGGTTDPAISMITVDQYWGINLEPSGEIYQAEAGGTFTGYVTVENTGNGADTFTFDITNDNQFIGWEMETTSSKTMDPFGTIQLAITGIIPSTAAVDATYTIKVKGRTDGGGTSMTDTASMDLYVKAPPEDPEPGGDGGDEDINWTNFSGTTGDNGTAGQEHGEIQPETNPLPGFGVLALLFALLPMGAIAVRKRS